MKYYLRLSAALFCFMMAIASINYARSPGFDKFKYDANAYAMDVSCKFWCGVKIVVIKTLMTPIKVFASIVEWDNLERRIYKVDYYCGARMRWNEN